MGLIYKPFGIILGILAGLLGKRLFNFAWTKIDDEEPPKGTDRAGAVGQDPRRRRAAGRDLQGHARVVVDRYGAIGWTYLTGSWPGEKRPDPDDEDSSLGGGG